MRSRLLLNLVLLAAVIGLALLAINTPDEQRESEPPRLTRLEPEQVERIVLQRHDEQSVTLYRQQGNWYMQDPYSLAANAYRVQALLRLLQAEYHARHPLEDPARYGLAQPRASITYNDSLTIQFGDTEPLSQQRYVRLDDQLYLLPDTHYYHTVSPATGYLSHALLPDGKITLLQLPGLQLNLQQGQWQLQPARENYSADALTELVDNWRNAQALRLQPYLQETLPNANIRIQLQDREQAVRFTLEQHDGQHSLLRHDARMRYYISEEIQQQLMQLPEPVPEPELERSPQSHEATKKN